MLHRRTPCHAKSRAALLALSLLSACAAADPEDINTAAANRPVPGASGSYLVGRFALGRTDLDTAAADMLKALQADPGDPDLQQQAFGAAVLAGRPEAADLAASLPGNPAALLIRAGLDMKAGDWRGAEAKLIALPGQGATQVLRPLLLAWVQQGAGATDEALNTLRPFVEGSRYRGVFALHAAMINDLAGRQPDATRLFRLALVEYGALNLRLGRVVASWQMRTGRDAEARATMRATVEANPDLGIAEPALLQTLGAPQVTSALDGVAEAYLALAASLQRQDAPDFSLLLLRQALALKPDFTAARLLAADIQSAARHWQAAAVILVPVPSADPLAAVVQLRQARLLEREGRTEESARLLDRMAEQYGDRPEPLAQLAEMQRAGGDYPAAIASYSRAIARLRQPARTDWALFYEQGMAYDRAHDWPRAEADFLRALDLAPDQPFVLNYLAYGWTEQGRNLPRARQMIERAVELRPNDGSMADSLGWVLLRQGDKSGAVRWLERAVELQPEDATINGHLGDAYQAAGRVLEAQTQWRRALILNPEPHEAAELQGKLAGSTTSPTTSAVERRVE